MRAGSDHFSIHVMEANAVDSCACQAFRHFGRIASCGEVRPCSEVDAEELDSARACVVGAILVGSDSALRASGRMQKKAEIGDTLRCALPSKNGNVPLPCIGLVLQGALGGSCPIRVLEL